MNDFDLADAISTIIISYRHDEKIAPLDRNHVLKWVNQFDEEDRHIILEETFRILKDQYYSRERIKEILNRWIEKLLNKFNTFDNIIFTNTQEIGSSQKILYSMIEDQLGDKMHKQSQKFDDIHKIYLYVDDGLYTGGRAKKDIAKLLEELPRGSVLYVFYLFAYSDAFFYWKENFEQTATNKNIKLFFRVERIFHNKRNSAESSLDFVWPSMEARKNPDVVAYEEKMKETGKAHFLYCPDIYDNTAGMFSTYEAGKVVGNAFLKYGLKICNKLYKKMFRPLGISNMPNFGLGTFAVTDFNISNTSPLVLWWGSLEETTEPLGCWYPLLPRRDNKVYLDDVTVKEEQISLEKLKPVFQLVYNLAAEERKKKVQINRTDMGVVRLSEIVEIDIGNDYAKSELLNYLRILDFERIKAVQTIMYIGRDYISEFMAENDGNGVESLSFPVKNPDSVFFEWMNYLAESMEWKSKDVEAYHIYEKVGMLCNYLEMAFTILDINLEK